jgi:hypothetical protein
LAKNKKIKKIKKNKNPKNDDKTKNDDKKPATERTNRNAIRNPLQDSKKSTNQPANQKGPKIIILSADYFMTSRTYF